MVGRTGAVEGLPREVMGVMGVCLWMGRLVVVVVMVVVLVLRVLLEQRERGVRSALPALHLVHGLGHRGERGRGRVRVKVRGRAKDGGVLMQTEGRRGGGGGVRGGCCGRGVRGLTLLGSAVSGGIVVVVVVGGGQDGLLHLTQIERLRTAGHSSLLSIAGSFCLTVLL